MELNQKLKKILEMWPNHTIPQIAKEIGETKGAVAQYVNKMRAEGLDIPKKRVRKFDWKKFTKDNEHLFNNK